MKKIVEVKSKKELATFIDFPHELYKNDPSYVPELFIAQKDLLTTHPFHKHSSLQTFLLYDGDKVTGRIAAILNTRHNTINEKNDGFFGFFDCINDQESAQLLFETAEKWLKEKGVETIVGPVNFSTNESSGLLVKGFDIADIKQRLNIHSSTLSTHKSRIFEKMEVRNVVELVEKVRMQAE